MFYKIILCPKTSPLYKYLNKTILSSGQICAKRKQCVSSLCPIHMARAIYQLWVLDHKGSLCKLKPDETPAQREKATGSTTSEELMASDSCWEMEFVILKGMDPGGLTTLPRTTPHSRAHKHHKLGPS